jgi:regulatory protein
MQKVITALKTQKSDPTRVNVFVNGQRAFVVGADAAAELRSGEVLSKSRIAELQQADERNRAYRAAIRFLGFRARSKMELEAYLDRKGHTHETARITVDRLTREDHLNDRRFARLWIANRERFTPRGAYALRYELREKGVADDIIEDALADFDEEAAAWTAVKNRMTSWERLDPKDFKKKIMGFLHRRGFDDDASRNVLRRAVSSLSFDEDASTSRKPDRYPKN